MGRKVRREYTAAVTPGASDDAHSRRELLELIGRDSGRSDDRVASTLDEIIAGRWLEPTGRPNQFRLRGDLAPFALGLALVSDLKMLEEQERRQTLSKLMDDLRGQSLGTDILRSAVTVSLLDSGCSATLRRELLVRWTSEQNFSNAHFQSYWRLIALDPHTHFDAIDAVWSACNSTSQQDEIFVHGTTLAAEKSRVVLEGLCERLTDWLGTYWLDRFEGAVLNYDEHAAGADRRRMETSARVHAWSAACISLSAGVTRVAKSDNGKGTFWRNKRAAAWLSHLDRTPFSQAIASWAIAGALMGLHHFSAEIGWALRMNLRDHEQSSERVQSIAMELLSTNNEVAQGAARALLKALALASGSTPALHAQIASTRATNVGATNALDPESPPVDQRARVEKIREDIAQNKIWNQQGPTREDLEFEASTSELARWAPTEFAQLLRSLLARLHQSGRQAIEHRATELPKYLPLLSSAELLELKSLRMQLTSGGMAVDSEAVQSLLFSSLLNATASEQIKELMGLSPAPILSEENAKILATPAEDDFKLLRMELLGRKATEHLRCWLGYLKSVSLENMPDDLFEVVELTLHTDAQVREMALDVLIECDRPTLLKRFSEIFESLPVNVTELEALKRGVAICENTRYDSHALDRLRGHAEEELLPYLCMLYPNDPGIIEEFSCFVRSRLQLLSSDKRPRSLKNYRLGGKAPIEALIKHRFENVLQWLHPVISGDVPLAAGSMFFEPYPLLEVCEALLRQRPEVGVKLWHRAMDALRSDVFQIPIVQSMLFTVPNSPAIGDARRSVIERAKTDRELQSIILSSLRSGEEGWLLAWIQQDLQSEIPGLVARGLTMAGMLDASDDAKFLWSELREPSGSDWLSLVWRDARRNFYRNVWARHWFDLYLSAKDPIQQIANYHLFSECADERAVHWASLKYNAIRASLPEVHTRHLRAVWPKVVRRIERNSKNKLSKELMHTKALSSLVWPWS